MFLSFIVPVYNVERFLSSCIDSMLQQDISPDEYEIICVNDGSTDGSLDILRSYEKADSRLTVINQRNSGVCSARNAGLERARGEYIWFIDADDCIEPNCLAMLKSRISESTPDRVVIENYSFPEQENPYSCEKKTNTVWKDSSACKSIFRRSFLSAHKLFFRYPELIYGEDALFMYEVKWEQPDTIEMKQPLYYCRERTGSASRETTNTANLKRLNSTIREAEIMKQYYDAGRRDVLTTDRMMSYLYGALFHIASMSQREANARLNQLRTAGLFPLRRPLNCTIQKSFSVNRGGRSGRTFSRLSVSPYQLHCRLLRHAQLECLVPHEKPFAA